ncbi:MAG: transcriptional regulator, partial [Phenylobacterium sp.]|uniref:LysR substrate-binding domain-containing protein n=1 Tax=Phenylobacterium sp. TaxID=1871053 RepID=UPI001A37BE1C
LTEHLCINARQPTAGGLSPWEFEKGGRPLKVRVEGQLAFNVASLMVDAALSGLGLAYVMEDRVEAHLRSGRLKAVLRDWSPPFPGYHLYYPSSRQHAPAFALLVEALRYRGPARAGWSNDV